VRRNPPATPGDHWQKHYYRGIDVEGEALIDDHQSKLRLRGFDASAAPNVVKPPPNDPPERATEAVRPQQNAQLALAKREWLLEALQRQHDLGPGSACVERRADLTGDEFLERYYAANRPVILTGELAEWPALSRWSPHYLKAKVGSRTVEYQGGREANSRFEIEREAHRREAPFDLFIDATAHQGASNDSYITAFNSERNREALAILHEDMGFLGKILDAEATNPNGMMWIGPAGTFTPLHHDLTNNLIAQIVGRKRVKLLPASEVGKLYNDRHVYSEIADLEVAGPDLDRHPPLARVRSYDVLLEPGEVLFIPLAWWHQVKSLDFSVTVTYTNFRWPNDAHTSFPGG
jgi:ribosomal protein L16 Arg81 hydroxylase